VKKKLTWSGLGGIETTTLNGKKNKKITGDRNKKVVERKDQKDVKGQRSGGAKRGGKILPLKGEAVPWAHRGEWCAGEKVCGVEGGCGGT